jgi:hypothetical protein
MVTREKQTPQLLEQARTILDRLAPFGWKELFALHGLNIEAKNLKEELSRELVVDRSQPGFEDFASEGVRAIEPFHPAHSLLFHAFASPQVILFHDKKGQKSKLKQFPTFEEICIIENLVYGILPPSLPEIRIKANNSPLVIVVFASEYRPAITTVHQRHADKCFSRVGVSRVGTSKATYLPEARGFLPFDENDNHAYRVIPCYYSAYIAIQAKGDEQSFGPMRFQKASDDTHGDAVRNFWVPIHKLFSGRECLRGLNIQLKLSATHVNEKIRKVHLALAGLGYNTGWHEPDISNPPFIFHEGIAQLSLFDHQGEGLLIPEVHSSLVRQAEYNSQILTYKTPVNKEPFRSAVIIDSRPNGARSAPEYVYARHQLLPNGQVKDLNEEKDVVAAVKKGGYDAIHYQDFTGDGCIEVECPELAFYLPEIKPAYSMVSAVDFFPLVKQYDLINWWQQAVPRKLSETIWPANPGLPLSLCDSRYPANLTLTTTKLDITNGNKPRKVFEEEDDTISTVVGLYQSCSGKLTRIDPPQNLRTSFLPDGASGVYAPGWDASIDRTDEQDREDNGGALKPGVTFFNNYGLGSPFPEDAMLCAALSSFWPAAAPDITRSFTPGRYATATPLPDDIIGLNGQSSWNGIPGPRLVNEKEGIVEFHKIEYGDFIKAALENGFDYSRIARITAEEYAATTLVMARVYGALGALTTDQKRQWIVYSFREAPLSDPQRQEAEQATDISLNSQYTYRFELFRYKSYDIKPEEFKKTYVSFEKREVFFADPQAVLKKTGNGWTSFRY